MSSGCSILSPGCILVYTPQPDSAMRRVSSSSCRALQLRRSAGTPSENSTPRQATIYSGPDTPTILADRPRAVALTIAAPVAAVWLATKKVYGELEGPRWRWRTRRRAKWEIPTSTRRVLLPGNRCAQFVDCGSGMTGPKGGVVPHLHVAVDDHRGRRKRRDDRTNDVRAGGTGSQRQQQ